MIHNEPSPLAGKTVILKDSVVHLQYPNIGGSEFRVEDWWDRVYGSSWMDATGNPAALVYAMRTGLENRHVPTDNEVVYGKYGPFGCLIHVCEIEESNHVPD